MSALPNGTAVILFGTMHLNASDYPHYAQRLETIIEEIMPSVICAELSPEQLAKTQSCNSKPEQRDVVMPTADRLDIPIVPIQPSTEIAIEWEERFKVAEHELVSRDSGQCYHDFCCALARQEAELWGQHMKSPAHTTSMSPDRWTLMFSLSPGRLSSRMQA